MLRKQKMGMRELVYIAAFIIAFSIGVAGYFYVDHATNEQTYYDLIQRARSIAAMIEPEDAQDLTLSEADLTKPSYSAIKNKLIELKRRNPDLTFLYIMAKRENRVFFMVDSEEPGTEGYSSPGQEYTEVSFELLYNGWAPNEPYVLEVYEDRWGNWISALAPIVDKNGQTIALVGLDKNAQEHRLVFYIQEGLVACATILLLMLISMLYSYNKREKDLAEMKSDFVAVASHELRSPLTIIRWNLSSLRAEARMEPDVREKINDIYRRVCALIDLTSTFLLTTSSDHGIIRSEDFKIFNMAAVLSESTAHAQSLAQIKHVHINNTVDESSNISIKGDRERLRLVFDNLLSNAIKYSPDGSMVSISYEDTLSKKIFRVSDQGIGIPRNEIDQIFSGFHRAANAKRTGAVGSGFGLYMAKKIVDFHGGHISCESEVGHGTTFTVMLPTGI